MKIAILHDYFDKIGGGERLVINLARKLKADIYTGFIDSEKTLDVKGVKIISLGVRKNLPQLIRNVKIAKKFEKYKFPKYDFYIFSGVWCISAVKNHPNLLYLHTPPRFIYDLKYYFINGLGFPKKQIFKNFINYWKPKDQFYIKQFDLICPNSENVKKRVLKYYGKEVYKKCKVVYTGIETKKFYFKKYGNFYLSTSRLDPLKRLDLVIETFNTMPKKQLVIIGEGPEEKKLKMLAQDSKNINFLGRVDEKKLLSLYSTCKATIVASVDEDLGLSAIESQAAGKPVIAVNEGGFKETIIENKTGVFFEPTENSLKKAIHKLESKKWDKNLIKKNAEKYDINNFVNKIKSLMREIRSESIAN